MSARSRILAPVLIVTLSGAPLLAAAQTQPAIRSFVVTNVTQTAAGNVVSHELLSLVRTSSQSRIAVEDTAGTVVSTPVSFTAEGQIDSTSQDAGVTCFNMAMDALAHEHTPSSPASVFLRFGGSVVRVPLAVQTVAAHGSDRITALRGVSAGTFTDGETSAAAGIRIDATVEQQAGELRNATFDEIHYIGSTANIVARSTCLLRSAPQRATARV